MPYDVSTNTTYELVTRYDLDTATTTLWLNPASESDASVTASDVQLGATVVSYAFRQDADLGGTVLVDDLKVGLSFAAVTSPSVTRIPLSCQRSGGSVILRWSDAAFSLQAAPVPAGVYTNVPGASSPFTCQLSTGARYFRLKHN